MADNGNKKSEDIQDSAKALAEFMASSQSHIDEINAQLDKSVDKTKSLTNYAKALEVSQNILNSRKSLQERVESQIEELQRLTNSSIRSQLDLEKSILERKIKKDQITQQEYELGRQILEQKDKEFKRNEMLLKSKKNLLNVAERAVQNQIKTSDSLEKAIKYEAERAKKMETLKGFFDTIRNSSGELGHKIGEIYDLTLALAKNPMTAVIALIALAVKQFVEMDKAAEFFRRETGLTITQTKNIRLEAEKITREFANFGVTIEETYKAAGALSNTFSGNTTAIKDNLKFVTLMSTNLGISEDDSSKVLQNFMGMSGATSDTAQQLSIFSVELSKAAGVAPAKIMNDIAKASGKTLQFMRGNTVALIKAAVEARRLGTSLDSVAGSAESLLDFEGSFNKEMELSTLLGRNVNLMEMRRLAFNGDLAGLAKEQSKFLQEQGGLTGKNMFQVKAMAEAMGLSVDELTKMNAQQQLIGKLSSEDRKAYEDKLKLINNENDLSKMSAKEQLDAQLKTQEMQGKTNELMNEFRKISMQLGQVLLPIVQIIVSVLSPVLKAIGDILQGPLGKAVLDISVASFLIFRYIGPILTAIESMGVAVEFIGAALTSEIWVPALGIAAAVVAIGAGIAYVGTFVYGIGTGIVNAFKKSEAFQSMVSKIQKAMEKWSPVVEVFSNLLSDVIKDIKQSFGMIYEFGKIIGNFLGPIVSLLFKPLFKQIGLLFDIIGNLGDIFSSVIMGDWKKVLDSFIGYVKNISHLIYGPIIDPFVNAWEYLFGHTIWSGETISQVFKSVGNAIIDAGKGIFDFIISPYKMAWNFISDMFSKIPDLIKNSAGFVLDLAKNVGSIINSITGMSGSGGSINSVAQTNTIQGNGELILGKPETKNVNDETKNIVLDNKEVVQKLDELIMLLKGGAIAINLDGKKVSSQLATAISY